jgi:ribonuclease HI
MSVLHVYTDGSIDFNPGGTGGYGAVGLRMSDTNVGLVGEVIFEISGSEFKTSNNRMELLAAIEALKMFPDEKMTVYSDSQYLINGATKGIPRWVISGTMHMQTNADLWLSLYNAIRPRPPVQWQWVRGHADNDMNNKADELAGKAMRHTRSTGQLVHSVVLKS